MQAQRFVLDETRQRWCHGPIDLIVQAEGQPDAVAAAHASAWTEFEKILLQLVQELPLLRCPVQVGAANPFKGPVARTMWQACQPLARVDEQGFITPMAAVAGAVAQHLLGAPAAAAVVARRGQAGPQRAPGGLLGIPPHDASRAETFKVWHANVKALAQFPNLTIKVGGLGMLYCGWDFHMREVPPSSEELADAWRPYVEACIEAFGPARCIMESNFPVDKQSCGYDVLWNALKRITANFSPAEKLQLYRDTAARVYRLSI